MMLEIEELEHDREVAFMHEYGSDCGMKWYNFAQGIWTDATITLTFRIIRTTCGIFGS